MSLFLYLLDNIVTEGLSRPHNLLVLLMCKNVKSSGTQVEKVPSGTNKSRLALLNEVSV